MSEINNTDCINEQLHLRAGTVLYSMNTYLYLASNSVLHNSFSRTKGNRFEQVISFIISFA